MGADVLGLHIHAVRTHGHFLSVSQALQNTQDQVWSPAPLGVPPLCHLPHSGPLVSMEQLLRAELHTKTLRAFGRSGAGCISEGCAYDTDTGPVFVKVNRRTQVNEWQDDWPTFFTQHRLQAQLNLIEKDYADRETQELWSRLQVKIPDLFSGIEIVPALLHGDLWSGNVAEDDQGPIIYDPASFYGHSEFELAIALMFGGFPRPFFTAYHRKIPKAPGFDKRLLLYQLFNYLNHWNHFGREYRSPSLGMMRKLLR
ncbi:fructosamine-3-kinase isoform X3 [Peromyscus californicus insignis]|uniref:fructosamine-3-kinase isoform X3 n=1 Tax=Peromyscus californicus insignis TaxID=564181 RepID=UPI0022A6D150|nr:fructosamine-3-kinase isoform X3 [Peromyscus californicus insignis]